MHNNNNTYLTSAIKNGVSTLFTVMVLAEYLGIGRNRAYELLHNGTIKGFRIGSTWKVSKAAVDQYILKNSGF